MGSTARDHPFLLDDEPQPLVKRHIRRRRGFEPAGQPFGVGLRGLGADDPAAVPLTLMIRPHAAIVEIPDAPPGPMRVDAGLDAQAARPRGADGQTGRAAWRESVGRY